MDAEIANGHMGAKLALTRLTFSYFISETVFDYLVDAVHLVADEGWKLLPLYRFDPLSGLWQHRDGAPDPPLTLGDFGAAPSRFPTAPESVLGGQLKTARRIMRDACPAAGGVVDPPVSEEFERIRWFPLPSEGRVLLAS